jgi:hypothetical protein
MQHRSLSFADFSAELRKADAFVGHVILTRDVVVMCAAARLVDVGGSFGLGVKIRHLNEARRFRLSCATVVMLCRFGKGASVAIGQGSYIELAAHKDSSEGRCKPETKGSGKLVGERK